MCIEHLANRAYSGTQNKSIKVKHIQIILSIFSSHNGIKLESIKKMMCNILSTSSRPHVAEKRIKTWKLITQKFQMKLW